jgi:predicted house-cleaning NTP pyrophosphatase (Maf/HAM1 superfamily)
MINFQDFRISITSNRSHLFRVPNYLTSHYKFETEEFEILTPHPKESPMNFLLREAEHNVRNIFNKKKIDFGISIAVIGACGRRILRAFHDNYSSSERLSLLSGRRHHLLSCLSIIFKQDNQLIVKSKLTRTKVKIKSLTDKEKALILSREENIIFYLDNPLNNTFINWVEGSYSNLNGSYENELYNILQARNFLYSY